MALDRLKGYFDALVNHVMRRVDYFALYGASVIRQRSDNSLDLRPDSDRIGPIEAVPIRPGLPGVKVKVSSGARVRLGYQDGDPTKPFAALWDVTPGLVALEFDGGTRSVARVNDTVDGGSLTVASADGGGVRVITYTYTPPTPPGGAPVVWTLTYAIATAPTLASPGGLPVSVPIRGKITSGAGKVKA